ncbi:MAG: hypothetical protein VB913_05835 [Rhodospirillales bacterium]
MAKFAEAILLGSDQELVDARLEVVAAVGPDGMIDAAGVASLFNAIDRVADATGIPIEEAKAEMTEDLREDLGLNDFQTARLMEPSKKSKKGDKLDWGPSTHEGLE